MFNFFNTKNVLIDFCTNPTWERASRQTTQDEWHRKGELVYCIGGFSQTTRAVPHQQPYFRGCTFLERIWSDHTMV